MGFKIGVLHQHPRTDSSAIDDEIELRIDLFQFGKAFVWLHLAACVAETLREIIEVNGGVHKGHIQRETRYKCRGDFRAQSSRPEGHRPFRNFNFTAPRKLPQLDHRNAALSVVGEIKQCAVRFQRPGDRPCGRSGIVRIPDGRGRGRSRAWPNLLCQDRSAMPAFSENHRAG